jgi:hypothetical protein
MHPVDPSGTTSFDYRRTPFPLRLLAGLFFLVFGLWIVLWPAGIADTFDFTFGLDPLLAARLLGMANAIIGVTGIASWLLLRGMEDDAIRLTPKGLSVGAGLARTDIPWAEVTGTRVVTTGRAEMLGVLVSDPERLFEGRDPRTRKRAARATREYGTPVLIPGGMVKASFQDIAAAIERYREAHGMP